MNQKEDSDEEWLFEIKPKNKFFELNLKEVWQYRDLLLLFVKRDIVTVYKQTILGPLWYLIQPLFTSLIFTIISNTKIYDFNFEKLTCLFKSSINFDQMKKLTRSSVQSSCNSCSCIRRMSRCQTVKTRSRRRIRFVTFRCF